MKVLIINSVCGLGSTGRICGDIAEELIARGDECVVAYGRNSMLPERALPYGYRIGTDRDVKLHGMKTRILDRHGFGSDKVTREFISWIESYDPDVIHLHNIGVANVWDERKGLNDFAELAAKISSSYRIVLIGLTKSR